MIALSIRQPWAWLILYAGKDIENRDWATSFRGRFLIHASKGMTRAEYASACDFAASCGVASERIPSLDNLPRGGVVGSVELVDCVQSSGSPWFVGENGFVLRDPRPLTFVPWKGRLSFFDVPRHALQQEV